MASETPDAQLAQLTHAISHDLAAPLRHVSGYLSMLERSGASRLETEELRYLKQAMASSEIAASMVRDVVEHLRFPLRAAKEETQEVSVQEAVDLAASRLAPSIRTERAEIHASKLPSVQGKPELLASLFEELIGNALKFRRKEAAPEIRIEAERRGPEWLISVADNGMGVPPNARERVFELFRRAVLRAHEYSGTGAGLSLCQQIVDDHGGAIRVRPEEGENGSTFEVRLKALDSR